MTLDHGELKRLPGSKLFFSCFKGLAEQAAGTLTFDKIMAEPDLWSPALGTSFTLIFLLITISLFNYKNSWQTKFVPLTFIGRFAAAPLPYPPGKNPVPVPLTTAIHDKLFLTLAALTKWKGKSATNNFYLIFAAFRFVCYANFVRFWCAFN